MSSIACQLSFVRSTLPEGVKLVAVSKTHPAEAIRAAYDAGHRVFGESRPQELREKHEALPKDIEWHMIGHLQTNKIKYIAPFVTLIQSVDSARLAEAIQKTQKRANALNNIMIPQFTATIKYITEVLGGTVTADKYGEATGRITVVS